MNYLRWPLDKRVVTQNFGENPKVYQPMGLKAHSGVDFRTRFVDSPLAHREVYAARDGKVEVVRDDKKAGYGLHVRIRHTDGSLTIYGHLYVAQVAKDQPVVEGQVIGLSGNSGFSSGPHLHFEYRPGNADTKNGYAGAIDPLPLLMNYDLAKELQSAPVDTELQEVQEWLAETQIMSATNLDQPISRKDLGRVLLRFFKVVMKSVGNMLNK